MSAARDQLYPVVEPEAVRYYGLSFAPDSASLYYVVRGPIPIATHSSSPVSDEWVNDTLKSRQPRAGKFRVWSVGEGLRERTPIEMACYDPRRRR